MSDTRHPAQITLGQIQKLVIFVALISACVVPGIQLVRVGAADWETVLVMEGIAVPVILAIATLFLVRPGPVRKWIIAVLAAILVGVEPGFVLVKWGVADWPAVPLIESMIVPVVLAIAVYFVVHRWSLQEWVGLSVLVVCVSAALLTSIALLLTLAGFANEKLRSLRFEETSVSRNPGATSSAAWKSYFGLPFDIAWLIVAASSVVALGVALIYLLVRLMPGECPRCQRHLMLRESRPRGMPWPVHKCRNCGARFMKVPAHWEAMPEALTESSPRTGQSP